MQPGGGFKTFGTRPFGKIVLLLISIAVLSLSFLYLGAFIAIVAFLLFGLAIPIYTGWKIIRQLAIAGLAVLLVSAPLIAVGETILIRTPAPLAFSSNQAPFSGPVLANATVDPYTGDVGTNFTWTANLTPSYLPANSSGVVYVVLFVSNCPTGIGPSSPYCPSGYPYFELNQSFGANGTTRNQSVAFHLVLPDANIWYWQMDAQFHANRTTQNFTHVFLGVGNGLTTIEGPVSGDFFQTWEIVVLSILQAVLLYIGSVFYIALLVYWIFKTRQRRREAAAALPAEAAPVTVGTGPGSPPAASGAAPPSPDEMNCPNCHAVVYPNEIRCWKCGADLHRDQTPKTDPSPPLTGGSA